MNKKIVVIGAGPGGYVAALRAARAGARVTVIEQDNVGGTCLNWGCIPSKVMKTTAELLERFRRAQEFGVFLKGDVGLDLPVLTERKRRVIQTQAKGIETLFHHHKIEYLRGRGAVLGPHRTVFQSNEGENREIPWDQLILATGSRPLEIPAAPFDGRKILSSNDALWLEEIPESILIVGGGVIGCEFAFILKALGARVTLVEGLSRLLPLPSVDEDCSKVLQREMKKQKIAFLLNRTLERVDGEGDRVRAVIGPSPFAEEPKESEEKTQTLAVDQVLVCIGRTPNTSGIGLDALGIRLDGKGWIPVNEGMKTNVPNVYAVGDVLGPDKIMLAHVASTEGLVAADNAVGGNRSMDYRVVPGAVFTMPEVADVGLTEAQARQLGLKVRSDTVLFRNVGKAQVIGEIAGQVKIVSDADKGTILGVHMVGPRVTDLIAEGALAVQSEATAKDLAETIHAHPTLAEIMLEVSLKATDQALHG